MSDNKCSNQFARRDGFKEAVCINASRIYDACRDRDCLERLKVRFVERDQEIIDNALSVKLKSAEVINVLIDTEPVPFNKGYYCVDLTVFFSVRLEAVVSPVSNPCEVCGVCSYNKKVILFGSDGCVKVFSSDYVFDDDDIQNQPTGNLPKVTCQIAEPVCLGVELKKACENHQNDCCCIPRCVSRRYGGSFDHNGGMKDAFVSLGVFMVIQLERQVQMLMPVYDFCMPEKVCCDNTDGEPCELFSKINFPCDAFFPPTK